MTDPIDDEPAAPAPDDEADEGHVEDDEPYFDEPDLEGMEG